MSNIEPHDDKQKFLKGFEGIRPDLFFPEEWDKTQIDKTNELIKPSRTRTAMFSSIPLRCAGPKCPYALECPLQQENRAPLNEPCPFEMAIVSQFMQAYVEELGVDPENLIEISMLRDLVDQEVQHWRKTRILSKEHFIQENFVGVDQQGNPILRKELHLAVDLEDRLLKRKRDLRNQLLATREARAKVGQMQLDTAQQIANLVEKVQDATSARDRALLRAVGREYQDDYIQEDVHDAEIVEDKEDE